MISGNQQGAQNAKRILLGHLASFGDCLFATPIARQIKQDYPGCHLTWAIGSLYRQAIEENPYVDEIWEFPLENRRVMDPTWVKFEKEARRRFKQGEFDEVFFTQINPNNYQNFDGTIRASILRGYPNPITVPVTPILRLRPQEAENVLRFVERFRISQRRHRILFECASRSGQSNVTPPYAVAVAQQVLQQIDDCAIILSSNEKIASPDERVIDGSLLSIRENAEMTKYCTLFVGCSSGISWVCTSDWAKALPMIQVLSRSTSVFASMNHDAEYFGLPNGHIIELTDCPGERLAECIVQALTEPFDAVRARFHEEIPVELNLYLEHFLWSVLRRRQIWKAMKSLILVVRRYGMQPFGRYAKAKLSPA